MMQPKGKETGNGEAKESIRKEKREGGMMRVDDEGGGKGKKGEMVRKRKRQGYQEERCKGKGNGK